MKLTSACSVLCFLPLLLAGCDNDEDSPQTGSASATEGTTDNSTTANASGSGPTTGPSSDSEDSSSATTSSTTTTSDPTTGETESDSDSDTNTETDSETDGAGTTTGGSDVQGCQGAAGAVKPSGPSLASTVGVGQEIAGGPAPAAGSLQTDPDPQEGGVSFIVDPDGGGTPFECSIWDQDCPDGEKCMPWANDGGTSWNATLCTPTSPNPDAPGDPCSVEGSGVSGVDSCQQSAMCWDVDTATNQGTCVAFCEGSEANPTCAEPNTFCSISNEGVLALCLALCNPLAPDDCGAGEGCYPIGNGFGCAPDASGADGDVGAPCSFVNACDPGNVCVNAAMVPGCEGGAGGCCSATCAVGDDSPCDAEQTCIPWWGEGVAPANCLEDLGVCGVAM